ncbi:PDR/VanB family oxidoreductase [Okibacterium endophyticum]
MTIEQERVHENEHTSARVTRMTAIADGVVEVVLQPVEEIMPWTAGSHIDLMLPGGEIRQYSLCGDPLDRSALTLAVLREVEGRGGSEQVHTRLAIGDEIGISLPRNHFPLVASPDYLFIAGGIGITPIRGMIAEAQRAGANWRLLYLGRSLTSMAYAAELASLGEKAVVWSSEDRGRYPLRQELAGLTAGTLVYACGPERLLRDVEEAAVLWPAGTLHVERFQARERDADADHDTAFEVEIESSGQVLSVPPSCSLLSRLHDAGHYVPSSCEEGTCGTCEIVVVDGEIDHRDSILSPAERESHSVMFPCVSRARSNRLVLGL